MRYLVLSILLLTFIFSSENQYSQCNSALGLAVPATLIEPVPELAEALLRQVLRRPKVKIWVEFVDHALISDDSE